jgi:hypothetical protein
MRQLSIQKKEASASKSEKSSMSPIVEERLEKNFFIFRRS